VAAVLTPVQTKQIRINIHKQNNTKAQYKQYETHKYKYMQVYYQNTNTYTHPHITQEVKTTTVQDTPK
jgi:hypothetical protein